MDLLLTVILIVVGVGLIVAELFLIPGFGLAGVVGGLSIAGGVGCAYWYAGSTAGHWALGISIVLCAAAIYIFLKGRALDKMALHKQIDGRVDLLSGTGIRPGDTGISTSRLAPMGKVRIGEQEAEAKSRGPLIEENEKVRVVAVEGNTVVVEAME